MAVKNRMGDDAGSVGCLITHQEEITLAFSFAVYKHLFNHFKICHPEPSSISVILD